MKSPLLALLILSCNACLDSEQSKTVQIHSDSIEQSKANGFFIDTLKLYPTADCNLHLTLINCWCEKAWKKEYEFFNIRKRPLPFVNYFIKYNKFKYMIRYRIAPSQVWMPVSEIIEPDLGFYFQVENKSKPDSVFIGIFSPHDSCEFYINRK